MRDEKEEVLFLRGIQPFCFVLFFFCFDCIAFLI